MDLDKMTIGEFKKLSALFSGGGGGNTHSLVVGECYLIRTVTFYFVGRVRTVTDSDIVLDESSTVHDTGRYGEALKSGELAETEFCGDGKVVGRGGFIDADPWEHDLPTASK